MDAIAVGSRTILVDDPLLTVRGIHRARPFTRVIFDRSLSTPAEARVLSTLEAGPVMILTTVPAATGRRDALERAGAQVEALPASTVRAGLTRLAELGGVDPALEPWGTSGNLYRFRCRARLADTPQITQHFEAVAAEQLVAVENVVAKVQSWRAERRARGQH